MRGKHPVQCAIYFYIVTISAIIGQVLLIPLPSPSTTKLLVPAKSPIAHDGNHHNNNITIITMGGGPCDDAEHGQSLKCLLTPDLLSFLVSLRLPYAKDASIDFSDLGRDIFLIDTISMPSKSRVLPVLIALSKLKPNNNNHCNSDDDDLDLTTYLPPPTDPSYPEQVLGLQLLLDQYTRALLQGIDARWTFGYFDKLSRRLAGTWLDLPPSQRPDSWSRWRAAGASLDYWLATRLWFGGPWVHSESRADQEIGLSFTDQTRRTIEAASGESDPNRGARRRDEILHDVVGFPREMTKGPPQGSDVTRDSFTWWFTMLMDIHKPIIDRFGRYPYLNSILGREMKEGEEAWIKETGHYGEATKEVSERIAEDVRKGRWTKLGVDSM